MLSLGILFPMSQCFTYNTADSLKTALKMMYFLNVLVYFPPISPQIMFWGKKRYKLLLFNHKTILLVCFCSQNNLQSQTFTAVNIQQQEGVNVLKVSTYLCYGILSNIIIFCGCSFTKVLLSSKFPKQHRSK